MPEWKSLLKSKWFYVRNLTQLTYKLFIMESKYLKLSYLDVINLRVREDIEVEWSAIVL
jgi:hypothetical protein